MPQNDKALGMAKYHGITDGVVVASKALVVDANKDITGIRNISVTGNLAFGSGGTFESDSGTATASSGSATLNKMAGKITTNSMTTAALGSFTLTVTNSTVASADMVFCSLAIGSLTNGTPIIRAVTPGSGSFTVSIYNAHATSAFNGTVVVSFFVVKA